MGLDESAGALDLALAGTHFDGQEPSDDPAAGRVGWLVRQPLDGNPATVREIPGALAMAVGGGHAIAFVAGARRVVISDDGGATVVEENAPEGIHWVERAVAREVGALLRTSHDDWLRIGWGPLRSR